MCGIIGFVGAANARNIIINGLHSLEYRGYDSAGVSFMNDNDFVTIKCVGKVDVLENKCENLDFDCNCAIGHTRWATHGAPTEKNAHPHNSDNVTVVHNGIIDNCDELKEMLISDGYTFVSETDTECIAHLIDREYKKCNDPLKAIKDSIKYFRGSYAIAIIFKGLEKEIWATRCDNPLVCVSGREGSFVASDIPAVLPYSKEILRIDDKDIVKLTPENIEVFDLCGNKKQKNVEKIDWNIDTARKDGFDHFMLKEIYQQPEAVKRTISKHVKNSVLSLESIGVDDKFLKTVDSVSIVACGSAYHAGLVGKELIEKFARIPTVVTLASEYRYNPPVTVGDTLVVLVSQSGETADTLAALRVAKKIGQKTFGIINAVGSAIARESDSVLYTDAGPEIAVATTKGYTTQLAAFVVLAMSLGRVLKDINIDNKLDELLECIPKAISGILKRRDEIRNLAKEISNSNDLYYIGRGFDYLGAQEASLKLKEISYMHTEAYAAGELKHGTLSLITDGIPVIAFATDEKYYDKMLGNIREVQARGAKVMLVCKKDFPDYNKICKLNFVIGDIGAEFSAFVTTVFSQLLAYEVAVMRGCDVDRPRNLAKSVTVE